MSDPPKLRPRYVPVRKVQLARELRQYATSMEALLWKQLRNGGLCGYKFRRQHPIGPYIADFACPSKKLVVELDGAQHTDQAAYDARRTRYLNSRGYRVIRFYSNEVVDGLDGLLENLLAALEDDTPAC